MAGIKLEKINWDKECEYDLLTGRGFRITEPATQKKTRKEKKDEKKDGKDKLKKSMYGIHSPLFCTDWSDDDAFTERYSCTCGEMKGKVFEDEVCPICGTKIIYRDVDLKKFGWIILDNKKIIHPIMYQKLEQAFGSNIFHQIITYDKKVLLDGQLANKESADTPFYGIGLIEFRERFDEIFSFYWAKHRKNKNSKREDLFTEIAESRDIIFTSCIPVYNSVLRVISYRDDNFCYTTVDKKYNAIFSSVKLLNDKEYYEKRRKKWTREEKERMGIPNIMSALQKRLMDLWSLIQDQLEHKHGFIRSEVTSGMINFTSRCEIIPNPELKADEIIINYMAFMELYKFEIIGCLMKSTGMPESSAFTTWFYGRVEYSEQIFYIMKYLVKKIKPIVTVHRNPVINYGSMVSLKIVDIDPDWAQYTISISDHILTAANADFDGDTTCVTSIKTKKLAKMFDKYYNPRKNMYISRDTGLLNNEYSLYKDQVINLYDFNNI
jgi:DNA-directed RNA polymerase beta' subunit